jgi:hypothetical protein
MTMGLSFISLILAVALAAAPRARRVDHETDAAKQVAHGDAAIEKGENANAITAYERALSSAALIPDTDVRYDAVNNVRLRLAEAHLQAHRADGAPAHLDTAEALLDEYVKTHDAAEPERAQALFDEIQTRRHPPVPAAAGESTPASDATPRPVQTGKPMLIAGATLTAVGGASAIGLFVTLGIQSKASKDYKAGPTDEDREEAGARHDAARSGAIATGVITAAALAAGIPLLVIGMQKRKATQVTVAPVLGQRGAAIAIAGRF